MNCFPLKSSPISHNRRCSLPFPSHLGRCSAVADARSTQDHCIFFSCFMSSQVCWHIPRDYPAAPQHPKLSRLILTDPFPSKPDKASACPGAAASCPARGCPQGGFYSTPPSLLFFFPRFSVRVSAVNYICLSARAANLLSPSGKREVRKQR